MPSYSGVWSLSQQFQGRGQGLWPQLPGAPTIGTASNAGVTSASVAFTAPACSGVPATITGYTATSTPGCITGTGAASPITVSGLTTGTAYTFKVKAQNATGFGPCSAASNSATPAIVQGQDAYTTAGTFSWVAPSGVTSVSVVAVGGGGPFGPYNECNVCGANNFRSGPGGGGGGGLGYKNNITVVPGTSYTVVVGAGGIAPSGFNAVPTNGGQSYFISAATVRGGGGTGGLAINAAGTGGTYTGDGGGNGGVGGTGSFVYGGSGGGAGGYAGNGGAGVAPGSNGIAGTGGGGGSATPAGTGAVNNAGGSGGVGILGQGANGTAGSNTDATSPGGGGSGGASGGVGALQSFPIGSKGGAGGAYGGAMGSSNYGGWVNTGTAFASSAAGVGAVRIIWPGTTRSFPSTNTGNL
jgi:hypothetical protein